MSRAAAHFARPEGRWRMGNRVGVWKEVNADVETPVSAYLKIRRSPYGFLFESVEGGERAARYSFLGSGCAGLFSAKGNLVEETREGRISRRRGNPLEIIRSRFPMSGKYVPGLPRFCGGLVGYVGYDAVREIERLPRPPEDDRGIPDIFLMQQDSVLVFDHLRHKIQVVAHVAAGGGTAAAYREAERNVDEVIASLNRPGPAPMMVAASSARAADFRSNITHKGFIDNVLKAKRYIKIGDIIQVVLSQRLEFPFDQDPFRLYRTLRVLNPSPYMFFLECGETALVGSSPEMLVRLEAGQVETRPIAGTRPRGRSQREDLKLERELMADPKERAEHVMLVDLGRNDLGRVCRYGSVRLSDNMIVERYSHVMHLVSGVKGRLRPGLDAFDVLRACFPAGTVSGAPKVRAMEIIDELEPTRRGPYGGAAGYVSYNGNMDTAIAIRTFVVTGGKAYMQAGMGIVADSRPEREYQESLAKSRAGMHAVAAAGAHP